MESDERIDEASNAFRLDSIKSRILALALLATIIPVLSTAVLSYGQNRRALTETLEGELQGIGAQAARELQLWTEVRQSEIRIFVSSYEVSENLARIPGGGPFAAEALTRLNNYLAGVQVRSPEFAELLVVDSNDEPVASTRGILRDIEVEEEWRGPLSNGETVVSDPYFDDRIGEVAATIGHQIITPSSDTVGVLFATLTFGEIARTLDDLAPGDSGLVNVVTIEGRSIVGSSGPGDFELAIQASDLEGLADAEGTIEFDRDGEDVLGTRTDVPGRDWTVVALIPSAEAYAQLRQARNSTILLASFLLVFVGVVAYFLGLVIARPLDRLTGGAAAVASGDLSVDLPVQGGGEVAYLTEVFNTMVTRLRRNREDLAQANRALKEHNIELELLSMTDALTGLYNRRYFMDVFEKEIDRSSRHDRPVSVLMIDVDKFKQYNDTWGHQAGDDVLKSMGVVLRDATRDPDVPARYGGEEFIMLLPDCALDGAVEAAERVRARLAQESWEGRTVTCSIGAAQFPLHGDDPKVLIAAADAALYEAKEAGRDRVMAAPTEGAAKAPAKADPKEKRRKTPPKQKAEKPGGAAAGSATDDEVGSAPTEDAAPKAKKAAPKKKPAAKGKTAPKKKAAPKKKSAAKKKPAKKKDDS